jgi:ABC-2 type transport system permease protein
MNVFWHELKLRRKSFFFWACGMVLLIILSMAKYETISAGGGVEIQKMLEQFPQTVQAIFGMNGLDIMTVAGYYGVCFLFIAVMAAIHAGLLGANMLAEEEQLKTSEFLYTKPRSRETIISAKMFAGTVMMIGMWIATLSGSIVGIQAFASMNNFWTDFWLFMIALGFIQLVFFSLGVLSASLSHRANDAAKPIAIIVFVSYLLYVFARFSPQLDWLQYGSIFSWFDAADIIRSHSINGYYIILCLIITCVTLWFASIVYTRRDLRI